MTDSQPTEPTTSDAPKAGDKTSAPSQGDPKPTQTAEEPLGEAGKRALENERQARKQAETELSALRTDFEGFKTSLSEAFGVQPATGGDDPNATLRQMQERLNEMERDGDVYRLAAEHNISDQEDLDILRSATDKETRSKLAERLAAKVTPSGTPKPDATQAGGHGTPPALNSDGLEQALKSKLGIT